MAEIADWDNFYVMVGSAAGALIGLQFVVLTLLDQKPLRKSAAEAGAAFMTPSIVHFGVTLLLSALLLAPWQAMGIPAILLSAIGFGGVVYIVIVALRMRRQKEYPPGPEDWLFHIVLPLAAYAILVWSLFADPSQLPGTLFGIGGAALLLLFTGIHNAWDNIAYTVFFHHPERK
jgi:hypothetical protein